MFHDWNTGYENRKYSSSRRIEGCDELWNCGFQNLIQKM